MALRLSSSLMVGITRVYSQQYHFYLRMAMLIWIRVIVADFIVDVNQVFTRLKRALLAMEDDVLLPVAQAKMETITMVEASLEMPTMAFDAPMVCLRISLSLMRCFW